VDDLGSDDEILASYEMLTRIMAPLVDLLLLETLSTLREVRNAARAAAGTGVRVGCVWGSDTTCIRHSYHSYYERRIPLVVHYHITSQVQGGCECAPHRTEGVG
jgi:hypothetical protein